MAELIEDQNIVLDGEAYDSMPTCNYTNYNCLKARIKGFELCEHHILEDKSLPFKQCSFTFPNSNKLCSNAVPIHNRKNIFCKEHSTNEWLEKCRAETFKDKPPECLSSWIEELSYHEVASSSEYQNVIPDISNVPSVAKTALDFVSNKEPEEFEDYSENVDITSLPRLESKCEFDFEDSETDPLDSAGIYTEDEASTIYIQKMKKLRTLYADQYKTLFRDLKQNRKRYILALKIEKETMSTIHSQPKENLQERTAFNELKSLLRYHRERGVEGLVLKQSLDRRMQASSEGHKPSSYVKCIYSEGSWRCGKRVVPMAKHCFKHILHDSSQVLYQECGVTPSGGDECTAPIISLPHVNSCIYHTSVPKLLTVTKSGEAMADQDQPEVLDFSNSSLFVVSEMPPDNVMEEDAQTEDTRTSRVK